MTTARPTRRSFLTSSAGLLAGGLGLRALAPGLLSPAYALGQDPALSRYDALLVLHLDGGLSPYEVCDLKDAGAAFVYQGDEFPAATARVRVGGATDVYGQPLVVSELLGLTARRVAADGMLGLGVVRALYHRQAAHAFAARQMNCCWQTPVEQVQPSLASVVAHYLKGRLQGADGRPPAALIRAANGDGANDRKGSACPTGLWLDPDPAIDQLLLRPPVDAERYARRRAIAGVFNRLFQAGNPDQATTIGAWDEAVGQAHDLSRGAFAGVFDGIAPLPTRAAQKVSEFTTLRHTEDGSDTVVGPDTAGARRLAMAGALIEAGVPFVQVGVGGFDSHTHQPGALQARLGLTLDPALGGLDGSPGLLERLRASGKRVLIAIVSEFGRLPNLNRGAVGTGREHYATGFSTILLSVNQPAFRSTAIGDTGPNGRGALGVDRPRDAVTPAALGHLLLQGLGFDTLADAALLPTSAGLRPPVDPTYYADADWDDLPTVGGKRLLETFGLAPRASGLVGRQVEVTTSRIAQDPGRSGGLTPSLSTPVATTPLPSTSSLGAPLGAPTSGLVAPRGLPR